MDEPQSKRTKDGAKILEEEDYLEKIDKIIQRDFFPDLPKLRNQLEWLEAVENDDMEKMRQIQIRMSTQRRQTPATFATPVAGAQTPAFGEPFHGHAVAASAEADLPANLDRFLDSHTSEDNASFDKLQEEAMRRHREKYFWLYTAGASMPNQPLALPAPSANASGSAAPLALTHVVVPLTAQAANAFMGNATTAPLTPEESTRLAAQASAKEISHPNTRITTEAVQSQRAALIAGLSGQREAPKARGLRGLRGGDEKVNLDRLQGPLQGLGMPQQSPQVRGYGFVATPSPAPGVDMSPIMTWGAVEGTPLLIDPTETPITASAATGAVFKVPATPAREQLAHSLADKTKERARQPDKESLKRKLTQLRSPHSGATTPLTSHGKAPASGRPTTTASSIDMQLRASYNSPAARQRSGVPLFPITPSPKAVSAASTPKVVSGMPNASSGSTSLTDNLLNI